MSRPYGIRARGAIGRVALVTALAGVTVGLGPAEPTARAEDDPGTRLAEIRSAIEDRRERLALVERQEASLLETLEDMDRTAAALVREVGLARTLLEQARREARAASARESAAEGRLAELRGAMAVRARALYKTGGTGPLQVLFSAGSLPDFLARGHALRRMLRHDRALVEEHEQAREGLARARAEAETRAADRRRASEALEERNRVLAAERAARNALLVEIRSDGARERAVLAELEQAARELEEAIEALRRRPAPLPGTAPGAFAARAGRLPPPVVGRVLRRFGRVIDSEFRTQTFRKGIDLAVELGEPVRAVADGRVRFAGRFRGYGNLVILDHGDDYFTVSGHLDEIGVAVGDPVREGDAIGTAGESGSLSGPRLYFEIRSGSEALDPTRWLAPAGRWAR